METKMPILETSVETGWKRKIAFGNGLLGKAWKRKSPKSGLSFPVLKA
jgi:hypothetical protein